MLPKIVENVSTQSSIILRLISKYSQQNRREMLFNNFKYIFSYLLRTVADESHLEKCLHYLQVNLLAFSFVRSCTLRDSWIEN